MNLTEKIALSCGSKISTPYVDTFFLPVKNDNYIIIDGRAKFESGEYDYFNDVVELIREPLSKNGTEIFFLSTEKMMKINCDRCFINLNKKQEAYLIQKAKLIVASENYSLHLAAALNTKSVGLYSIYNSSNFRPVWNKESQIVLESHRDGNKPSYGQLSESPKTINFISPFLIAKSILDSLDIENDLGKYELLHIGENFKQKIVEIVPDFTSDNHFLAGKIVNLRLDYVKSLSANVLDYWISNRKVNIITDKDVHVGFLQKWKANILSISVCVSDQISENFLKQCRSTGFQVKLFCNDKKRLEEFRFKFLDWQIFKDFSDKTLKDIEGVTETSRYISSKIILSKGKKYSCKANFVSQKEFDNRAENVILSELFDEELEFFKIYNEH